MSAYAATPNPPYYAAIFSAVRTDAFEGYDACTQRMLELAASQPGFLGVEATGDQHLGIGVSYWSSPAAIMAWKQQVEHLEAQRMGKTTWYTSYRVRICLVERDYSFENGA